MSDKFGCEHIKEVAKIRKEELTYAERLLKDVYINAILPDGIETNVRNFLRRHERHLVKDDALDNSAIGGHHE